MLSMHMKRVVLDSPMKIPGDANLYRIKGFLQSKKVFYSLIIVDIVRCFLISTFEEQHSSFGIQDQC